MMSLYDDSIRLSLEYNQNEENDNRSDDLYDNDRIEKSRERNREHAKKTRLRKKIMLEGLKSRLLELQNEATRLQQAYEESNTADILLHLGSNTKSNDSSSNIYTEGQIIDPSAHILTKGNIIDQLRSNVRAEAALKKNMLTQSGMSTNSSNLASVINSMENNVKSESYDQFSDAITEGSVEQDHISIDNALPNKRWRNGSELSDTSNPDKKMTIEEMDHMRKERNRMHAKLTRDRKKLFTSRLQQLISSLERQNSIMKMKLQSRGKEESSNQNIISDEEKPSKTYYQNIPQNVISHNMTQNMQQNMLNYPQALNILEYPRQFQFFQHQQNMYNKFYHNQYENNNINDDYE